MAESSTSSRELTNLLRTAKAFSLALDGDDLDRDLALRDLERAAQRCAASSEETQGFAASRTEDPELTDDLLATAAADLDIGSVLLSAGVAADEVAIGPAGGTTVQVNGRRLFDQTLDRVELDARAATVRELRSPAGGAGGPLQGFGAAPAGPVSPEECRTAFEDGLAAIVDRTLEVFQEIWGQIRSLGPQQLVTAFDSVGDLLGAMPQVGRLVALGVKAMRRGLEALLGLMPEGIRDWSRRTIDRLTSESADGFSHAAVARALAAETVARQIACGRWDELSVEAAATARRGLEGLVEGFAAIAAMFTRLLRALAAAGSLAGLLAFLAPLAAWLTGATAAGCALAAGAVLVIARDHLDTEELVGRVVGMRSILVTAGVP
jgi:hypothetical protein